MKKAVLISLLLSIALLAACVPTPETDYVVNRGEEDPEALIRTTPTPDAIPVRDAVSALPDAAKTAENTIVGHWKGDVSDVDGVTVLFDADVVVPDLAKWPIYAVEKGAWSAADRIAILKAAANGAPIYAVGMYQHVSKAYYEKLLEEMRDSERVAAVDRIYAEDPDSKSTWTSQVQEFYRYAPETVELTPFDEAAASDEAWTAAFYRAAEPDVYMDFYADETQIKLSVFDQNIQDENYVRQGEWPGAEPGRELVNPSLSLSEAEEKAQRFLRQIGFGDAALSTAETRKAQRSQFFTFAVESEGYLLVFRKGVNGIPGIAPDYPEVTQTESYAAAWPQERAELYVDSEGIWSLSWQNPTRITETLTESAALLDFDAILQLIRTRLRTENANASDRQITKVCVKRMRLGYSIVPKKDAPDAGYTLPVWIVDYEVTFEGGRTVPYSFTLSALNGASLHLDTDFH